MRRATPGRMLYHAGPVSAQELLAIDLTSRIESTGGLE
jgi:hypothetical protein